MAGFDTFDRELTLATTSLQPEAIGKALATYAREQLKAAIADGASPIYDLYVNGQISATEDGVTPPGPIVYQFSLWEPIITFALGELQKRSPVKSGRFRNSFIVISSNRIVTDYDAINARDEVIITNFQPYVRKAENGLLGTKRYAIFDGTKRALSRQFGNSGRNSNAGFEFETQWLTIGKGVHPDIPYLLKTNGRRRASIKARKSRLPNRKDAQAGQPITYPSVVMNMVY